MKPRTLVAGVVIALLLAASRPASAQIHWDASAQVGIQRRTLSNRPMPGDDADFGPTAMVNAHIALLPLLRLGAYLGHDISPMQGDLDLSARDLTWGGVRAKILSPWPRGTTRAYAFVGFGYNGTYVRSTSFYEGAGEQPLVRDGAIGHFFEVPFGLGASYTFWKPWAVVVELGARVGFDFSGDAYEPPGPGYRIPGRLLRDFGNRSPDGDDSFGIGLTIGIMLDE